MKTLGIQPFVNPMTSNNDIIIGNAAAQAAALNTTNSFVSVQGQDPATVVDSYTKLLLHFEGADNSTSSVDSSPNPKTITYNGAAANKTATKKYGSSAVYLPSDGSYIDIPANADLNFGTGPFTIDFWTNPSTQSQSDPQIFGTSPSSSFAAGHITIRYNKPTANKFGLYIFDASPNNPHFSTTNTFATGTWYHVALIRHTSTTIGLYVNGVLEAYSTTLGADVTFDFSNGGTRIGKTLNAGSQYFGYVDELRASNTVRWAGGSTIGTAYFVPPAAPYAIYPNVPTTNAVPDTGTKLLVKGSVVDSSAYGKTVTNAGAVTVSSTVAKFGQQSLYFNGTATSYLSTPWSTDYDVGSDNFCIDFWMNPAATANNTGIFFMSGDFHIGSYFNASNKLAFGLSSNGTSWTVLATTATSIVTNTWTHVACVRHGNTVYIYLNGKQDVSTACTIKVITRADNLYIGMMFNGSGKYTGYIQEFRISNYARFTSDFAVPGPCKAVFQQLISPITTTGDLVIGDATGTPTRLGSPGTNAVLTSDLNGVLNWSKSTIDEYTKLLLHLDGPNGGKTVIDSSTSNNSMSIGSTSVLSTGAFKFGQSSILFDGTTNSYIQCPYSQDFVFGTGDFTIDFWLNCTSLSVMSNLVDVRQTSSVYQFVLQLHTSGTLVFETNYVTRISTGAVITTNKWYHVAVVKYQGGVRIYVNGVQYGITYTETNSYTCRSGGLLFGKNGIHGGENYTGYMDEIRISNVARWTTEFVPPATPYVPILNNPMSAHGDIIVGGRAGTPTRLPVGQHNQLLVGDTKSYTWAGTANDSTKLLLHFDGPNTGTTIYDSSGYNKTVTVTGVTLSTTKSVFGGTSAYFSGTSSYLRIPFDQSFELSNQNFTIDFWANFDDLSVRRSLFSFRSGFARIGIIMDDASPNNKLCLCATTNGSSWDIGGDVFGDGVTALVAGTWYHIAIVRNVDVLTVYVNGVQDLSLYVPNKSISTTASVTDLQIGLWTDDGYAFKGYIDEFRYNVGLARWTSNFTPPTSQHEPCNLLAIAPTNNYDLFYGQLNGVPQTLVYDQQNTVFHNPTLNGLMYGDTPVNDTYTKLLLHGEGTTVVDSSLYTKTVTVNNVTLNTSYYKFGAKSMYFNNTSTTYLSIPWSSDFDFAANDFTIDFWYYGAQTPGTLVSTDQTVISFSSNFHFNIGIGGASFTGKAFFSAATTAGQGSNTWDIVNSALSNTQIYNGSWYHIALARANSTFFLFVNGVLEKTITSVAAISSNNDAIYIGRYATLNPVNGYIDEFRVSKGVARWTAPFAVPTTPYANGYPSLSSLTVGSPVGGNKGNGSVNATAIYENNGTNPVCYPLEYYLTGAIDKDFWFPTKTVVPEHTVLDENNEARIIPESITYSGNPLLQQFIDMVDAGHDLTDIDQYVDYWVSNKHLPFLPKDGHKYSMSEYVQRMLLSLDLMAIHISKLDEELKGLGA